MNLYSYDGPVMEFDVCIADNWKSSTWAASSKKARSNLAYQFKKRYNRIASSNITLPGEITLVREGGTMYAESHG